MPDAPSQNPEASGSEDIVVTVNLPTHKLDLYDFIKTKRLRVIQAQAQHLKTRTLTEQQIQDLRAFFVILNNIEMTPELKSATKLDVAMDVVMRTSSGWKFPAEFQEKAKNLMEYWEGQNWGADEVVEESESESESDDNDEDTAGNAGQAKTQRRPRPIQERITMVRRPPRDHPIFGENGIMHGIFMVRGQTTAYKFDDTVARKNPAVFGHNGIEVGSCWPLQIAALRDGAHGSRMAGISGKRNEGAYSVVVSGMYAGLDKDHGDVLLYSGSDSHANEDPDAPKITGHTRVLMKSVETRRPVRVIRSRGANSRFSPAAGLRYDGLFEAVSYAIQKNKKGGAYVQFRLERCGNQPSIDLHRPTHEEKRLFEDVKAGY